MVTPISNYMKYRGKCKELSEEFISNNPSYTLVRGHYYCPIWNKNEPHWWTKCTETGKIHDPTVKQFPSNGAGDYEEFDGRVTCVECGKNMSEDEASEYSHGNYVICSGECYGSLVGISKNC